MILVVVYMLINPKITVDHSDRKKGKFFWLSIVAFFFVGLYGGFIQAGVGFIIIMALSGINHFTLVKSNAIKVFVALVYNLSSIAIFAFSGMINWKLGLYLFVGNALCVWVSIRYHVKIGVCFVRIFLIIMLIVMGIIRWFFK